MSNRNVSGWVTDYAGPVRCSKRFVAGREIVFYRPAEPDRLLDDARVLERNARDDYMPYWAYVWPGARLLAAVLENVELQAGTRALEIGCGLGLAGLVGLARGLHVVFSDYDPAPLSFVDRSAKASGFSPESYSTRLLDWRDLPSESYSLILGADVLYEKRLIPLVAGLLERLLARDGLALLAGPYRVATEGLEAELSLHGLRADVEAIGAVSDDGDALRGALHRVRWR